MTLHPLTDCDTRLRWANADRQALTDEIRAFVETDPYRIRIEMDGGEGAAVFCRLIDPAAEAEAFDRFSRLLSSYLDNVQAALNYMTYQVALLDAPTCPALKPYRVEFPIFREPSLFQKKNRVEKLSDEHRRLFESVQPYDGQREGLWLLHELARINRHRMLHPARVHPVGTKSSLFTDTTAILLDMETIYNGPLEDGREVVRFTAVAPNGMEPKVRPGVALTVGVDHPLCRGRNCQAILNEINADAEAAMGTITEAIWPK
jgi:hypothetical protein